MTKQNCKNNNINNITYCAKCGSVLTNKRVKDHNGYEFCDNFCRKEYHSENTKEADSRYREWCRKS